MALPATALGDIAHRLKASPLKTAAQLRAALEFQHTHRVLSLGIPALDELLPQQGLLQGSVIELQVHGASGAATSFALCACRAAQRAVQGWNTPDSADTERADTERADTEPVDTEPDGTGSIGREAVPEAVVPEREQVASRFSRPSRDIESSRPWCAFIDPSASLFAPGVERLGVALDRLLVVRPDIDSVERVAIRIAEAKTVSLLVIDLRGALGDLRVSSHRWPRTVRRLALAVKHLATCILLITPAEPRQALPWPVAMRLEFARSSAENFEVRIGKERGGRVSSSRKVPWSAFDGVWQ